MTTRKEIGKIKDILVGHGGYQEAMIGVSFVLEGKGWGVNDFWGTWYDKRSANTKWTEEERLKILGEAFMRLNKFLLEAKKSNVQGLENTPVEVTFENDTLVSWRILTEVL